MTEPRAPLPPLAVAGSAGAAAVAVLLGVLVSGQHVPTTADRVLADGVDTAFGGAQPLLRLLALPTHPVAVLGAVAAIAVACAVRRQWSGLTLALVAPAVAVALNTWLLKPAFGRYYDDHLAYPSGHTVSMVSVLTVLAVLAPRGTATRVVVALGALLVPAAGTGMVGLGYHYASDVAGGALVAVAVTMAVAMVSGFSRHPNG